MNFKILKINNSSLKVEVATTDFARQKGLQGRKALSDNEGMLFVFKKAGRLRFWMKNTKIPLSIAFIDTEGAISEIKHLNPEDETPVVSSKDSKFALEVAQGWFLRNKITVGDSTSCTALLPMTKVVLKIV